MPFIIKNGKYYGSSADGSVDITEEEYNNLLESGQVNPSITYYITDGELDTEDSFSGIIEVTQQEYDTLSDEEKNNGAIYAITDSEDLAAKNMAYDGSVTGLGNNVQDAIDNVNDKVDEHNKKFEWERLESITNVGSTSSNFIQLPNEWNECHIEVDQYGKNAKYTIRLIHHDGDGYYRVGQAMGQYGQVSTNMVIIGFFDNKIFLEQSAINGESVISDTFAHCWYR